MGVWSTSVFSEFTPQQRRPLCLDMDVNRRFSINQWESVYGMYGVTPETTFIAFKVKRGRHLKEKLTLSKCFVRRFTAPYSPYSLFLFSSV